MFKFFKKDDVVAVDKGLVDSIEKELVAACMAKLKIKELEEQIETLKAAANDNFDLVFAVLEDDVSTVEVEGIGKITRKANTARETLNKDKLKELLIAKGMSAVVVKNCFDKATKLGEVKSPWAYMFKAAKE